MSAGHSSTGAGNAASDIARIMSSPAVESNLHRPFQLNGDFDLPYLSGYSMDARRIYFDRHLPPKLQVSGQLIDPRTFLQVHEHTEKAIIDALHYKYAAAHELATAVERRAVIQAGLNWQQYSNALKPFIKADEKEKLVSCPPDLDMSPYLDDPALLQRIKECQHTQQPVG